jgi:hypothetical protein
MSSVANRLQNNWGRAACFLRGRYFASSNTNVGSVPRRATAAVRRPGAVPCRLSNGGGPCRHGHNAPATRRARLHHRHFPRFHRRGWRIQRLKQTKSVGADLKGQRLTLLQAFRKAVILHPAPVALEPDRLCDRAHPVGREDGKVAERRAQRLCDRFQQVQIVHRGQHRGCCRDRPEPGGCVRIS